MVASTDGEHGCHRIAERVTTAQVRALAAFHYEPVLSGQGFHRFH
jgi:hypothetical protein